MQAGFDNNLSSALERLKNGQASPDDLNLIARAVALGQVTITPSGDSKTILQSGGVNYGESNEIHISGPVIGSLNVSEISSDQVESILRRIDQISEKTSPGQESSEPDQERKNISWTPIIVAIIGLFGTLAVAYATLIAPKSAKQVEIQATQTRESQMTAEAASLLLSITPTPSVTTTPDDIAVIPPATLTHTPEILPSDNPTQSTSMQSISLTPSPTAMLDLEDGCINQAIWTPYEGEAHPVDNWGCWDLQDWGIVAQDNGLSIQKAASSLGATHGIYRDLNPFSRIEFTLNIQSMITIDDLEPKLTFGILPSTLRSQDNGKYLSYQLESETQQDLYVKLVDGTINRGSYLDIRYTFGEDHRVTMLVDGANLSLYINGDLIEGNIHLPFEVSYFWIGYELPSNTSLDAFISDLTVIDQ